MSLIFEWDNNKATLNVKKHGISFEVASTIFKDYFSITISDKLHSVSEMRFITVGESSLRQVLVVSHKDKGNIVRIISARKATKKEKRFYEKEKS